MKLTFVFTALAFFLLLCSCEEPDQAKPDRAKHEWIAKRIGHGSVVYFKDSRVRPPLCFAVLLEDDSLKPSSISPLTIVPCDAVGHIAIEIGNQ